MDAGFGMIVSKFGMGFFLPDFATDPVDLAWRRALNQGTIQRRSSWNVIRTTMSFEMCSSLHERSKCEGQPRSLSCRTYGHANSPGEILPRL